MLNWSSKNLNLFYSTFFLFFVLLLFKNHAYLIDQILQSWNQFKNSLSICNNTYSLHKSIFILSAIYGNSKLYDTCVICYLCAINYITVLKWDFSLIWQTSHELSKIHYLDFMKNQQRFNILRFTPTLLF